MTSDTIKFNLDKAEASAQRIRNESEKLKRLTDKLQRTAETSSVWWAGDSRNGFMRDVGELISLLHKIDDLVFDASEDLFATAVIKRENEKRLEANIGQRHTI